MFEFITADANMPFAIALTVMLGIALLEGVAMLLGAGLSGFIDSMMPEFDVDVVQITMAYPGAAPEEVEQGIVLKIEEALSDLDGIERIFSEANESMGRLIIEPGEDVYEGQVIGIHSRGNDLTVNPLKAKQLTNIRAAGSDENILLSPPVRMSLEQALEFIDDDELVEVTPNHIRLRKKHLLEHERKRAARAASA